MGGDKKINAYSFCTCQRKATHPKNPPTQINTICTNSLCKLFLLVFCFFTGKRGQFVQTVPKSFVHTVIFIWVGGFLGGLPFKNEDSQEPFGSWTSEPKLMTSTPTSVLSCGPGDGEKLSDPSFSLHDAFSAPLARPEALYDCLVALSSLKPALRRRDRKIPFALRFSGGCYTGRPTSIT